MFEIEKIELTYGGELPRELSEKAATNGCVIVFVGDDYTVKVRGFVNDDFDAFDCSPGAYRNLNDLLMQNGIDNVRVDTEWRGTYDNRGPAWFLDTDTPCITFPVTQYGVFFCTGLMFNAKTLEVCANA